MSINFNTLARKIMKPFYPQTTASTRIFSITLFLALTRFSP